MVISSETFVFLLCGFVILYTYLKLLIVQFFLTFCHFCITILQVLFLYNLTYGADVFLVCFFRKREYNIKDNNLEGRYKEWQKKLHPDLVHSKSEVSTWPGIHIWIMHIHI